MVLMGWDGYFGRAGEQNVTGHLMKRPCVRWTMALGLWSGACTSAPPTGPPDPENPATGWSAPTRLFDDNLRLVSGGRLHAVGTSGTQVQHRSSTDEGATWSSPRTIPGVGTLPIYGPLAAEGATVYLMTVAGGSLQVQRSVDDGATWEVPVVLHGFPGDDAARVQLAAHGDAVHVFAGRAGATGDATFRVYYWRSTTRGLSFEPVRLLDPPGRAPASPGGIAVEAGAIHVAYAELVLPGTLGHRARYLRSADNGATWSGPVDISGPGTNPQIRPRPRVVAGRVVVLWEEPLDHDQGQPFPNATRSAIRSAISADNGLSWQPPGTVASVAGAYANHPEIGVGPGAMIHVVYRISIDQRTLSSADRLGYRASNDAGGSWLPAEIAIDDPARETHPFNVVATSNQVHVASANGVYVRRGLR